jgi:hypothetical protein
MAVWALIYTLSSMALGWVLKRAFKFPAYTLPAIAFNNTTALPLLLIQSLETSGILDNLTMGGNDTASAAASRAKSYFLVSAMVGNSLTFAIGPKLLDDEEAPDKHLEEQKKQEEIAHANGRIETDEEHAEPVNCSRRTTEEQEEHVTEATTLLPDSLARPVAKSLGKFPVKLNINGSSCPHISASLLSSQEASSMLHYGGRSLEQLLVFLRHYTEPSSTSRLMEAFSKRK